MHSIFICIPWIHIHKPCPYINSHSLCTAIQLAYTKIILGIYTHSVHTTTHPGYTCLFVCLCWGLTSQSTIFQSYRDGATASWVINQYFRGVKCLAQGHNTAAVGLEPPTSRSGVRHSTTEPPRSPQDIHVNTWKIQRLNKGKQRSSQFFAEHS